MKLAVSSLCLPPGDPSPFFARLFGLGLRGIELVPHRLGATGQRALDSGLLRRLQRAIREYNLPVIGFHGILDQHSDYGFLRDDDQREHMIQNLADLSAQCRDLGGRTLILERRRLGHPPKREDWWALRHFLEAVLHRIEAHGTILCLAPQPLAQSDLCTEARECYFLTNAIDHPALSLHVGAAALQAHGEMKHTTFCAVRGRLEHVHLDEPNYQPLGTDGDVDHADFRRHLAAMNYPHWLSIVQNAPETEDHLRALHRSVRYVQERYFHPDLH